MRDRYRAGKRLWSRAEERILRARYPHESTAAIARDLRRSTCATYARARQLGLTKTAAYLASPAACRLRRLGDAHPGRATQFKPGQIPANKGLRRPGYGPGRMKETQFKQGVRQGIAAKHWMPIGSTRLVDGYVYRKVSELPHVTAWTNWRLEHHLVWEAARGPIPNGHALVFKNGNRGDVRLDNLELIPRRQLMARNSVHTLPKSLALTIQLLGALNRRLRRKDRTPHEEQDGRSA